jgi:hypothetical protein
MILDTPPHQVYWTHFGMIFRRKRIQGLIQREVSGIAIPRTKRVPAARWMKFFPGGRYAILSVIVHEQKIF